MAEAEDALATLRTKYPEYSNIPDQELASRVIAKYPEYGSVLGPIASGPTPAPPAPVAPAPQGIGSQIGSALASAREYLQPAANNLVNLGKATPLGILWNVLSGSPSPGSEFVKRVSAPLGIQAPAEFQRPPETPIGRAAADLLNPVPATLSQAGGMLGTLAGPGAVGRIGLGALGAGGGALLEGKSLPEAGGAAALTGGLNAALEGAGQVGSLLLKSVPNNPIAGGKRNINLADTARFSQAMGEASAPLAGAPTDPKGLQDFILSGDAQKRLSARMELTAKGIEDTLKTLPSGQGAQGPLIEVPSLGTDMNPNGLMSFGEAWKQISQLGRQGFGGPKASIVTRTVQGLGPRQQWEAATQDVTAALDKADPTGELAQRWEGAKDVYSAGAKFLYDLLRRGKTGSVANAAFQNYADQVQLNVPYVQNQLSQKREELARKIPNFEDTLAAVRLTPETLGMRDQPVSGAGGLFDTLRMMANRRGGTVAIAGAPLTTPLPNIGSQYVGGNPYAMPDSAQALMDVLFQHGLQQARQQP